MSGTKRKGTWSWGLAVEDFAVGDAKSRAAARILAERMMKEQAKKGSRRGADPEQAFRVEIELVGTGGVRRRVYTPPEWIGVDDVSDKTSGE